MADLDHLFATGFTRDFSFKSTLSVRGQTPPQRDRPVHGAKLLRDLAKLQVAADALAQKRAALGIPESTGMTIVLEISPIGTLDFFKSLEWKRDGIEVLSSNILEGIEIVALHVPKGKLTAFQRRVNEYVNQDTVPRTPGQEPKPKNANLVNAIASFRHAVFDELWTDDGAVPPSGDALGWVQIWLRCSGKSPQQVQQEFRQHAEKLGIEVDPGYTTFPGRVVVAAKSNRSSLEQALELLDLLAEIRSVQPNPEFFLSNLPPYEQGAWTQDLQNRCTYPQSDSGPYVTLLDTGVNHGHILLSPALDPADLHAIDPTWGASDHHGHGTQMAGLVCHGDLTTPLSSTQSFAIPHRMESVKILPPNGANPPHLYGLVTATAVNLVETAAASRPRVFATMTTAIGSTAGIPSEWSATVDQLAFGLDFLSPYLNAAGNIQSLADQDLKPRLIVAAAGNVHWTNWQNFPSINELATIEDPGQAWNILTVGACTNLTDIDLVKWPSLSAIALGGDLSPSSTTSMLWKNAWPIKPDVVAEGGNGSIDTSLGNSVAVGPESLRILTTSENPGATPFVESGDTSAASAEVARLCAHLRARYPDYWEETVRALVIHGARHTPFMRSQLPASPNRATHKRNLLRKYGYGLISFPKSLSSDFSAPTIVVQDLITPYVTDGNGGIKLNELKLHALPWPKAQLESLGGASVALRATLSYLIEPNPSRRGWQSKYRYQSHGLRFAVKSSLESQSRFLTRINQIERELLGSTDETLSDADSNEWDFGANLRSRGSVHSDVWTGTGAQLAEKSDIAIYPVGGWWKDWKESDRASSKVRYSLVVSLEVLDEVDIDLYTPVKTAISIQNPISVEVPVPPVDGYSSSE